MNSYSIHYISSVNDAMASAIAGTTERLGVWNIHDAASEGLIVTRYGTSCPICIAVYIAKVESLPPE